MKKCDVTACDQDAIFGYVCCHPHEIERAQWWLRHHPKDHPEYKDWEDHLASLLPGEEDKHHG